MSLARSSHGTARRGNGGSVRLNVKLVDARANDGRAIEVIRSAPGVRSVVHTFPDEKDPQLATLFLVEVDPSEVGPTEERLRRMPTVEYVEQAAPRALIR